MAIIGLSTEEVEERIENSLTNTVDNITTKTYKKIIFGNLVTFFNFIFIFIALWLITVNAISDLVFLGVVTANLVVGIFQEVKSKKIIDKLTLLNVPNATVIRDKKEQTIDISTVVLDDIIVLNAGEQIPADAVIIKGKIEVNESMLTGESDLIKKRKDSDLYGGSFVVSGSCFAKVIKVGNDTYVHGLTKQVKTINKPNSEILHALNWLIRIISIVIIPLGYFSFVNNINAADSSYAIAVVKTSAGIIGMIPAGLYLMTSVSLAVGAMKLAKNNTLVQNLFCIETLARVDVLCLDKTGTITDGSMKVDDYFTTNDFREDEFKQIVSSMLFHLGDKNQTALAMIAKFGAKNKIEKRAILPFSSKRKYSAVSLANDYTFLIGAPEFVITNLNRSQKLLFSKFTKQGNRLLAVGRSSNEIVDDKVLDVELIGYIVISDNIRKEAFETLKFFEENNVEVKVISGDNVETVSEIARMAGVKNADKYISLENKTDKEVIAAANEYVVFGRVVPEQKKLLVTSLKNNGHQVGMTGDGVNDILALKEADCSIAMAEGSDAAKNVAQLVLMDSNFANMPKVVKEGRRVINNIQKGASLFLMKTVYSILVVVLSIMMAKEYPFRPIQMTLIELLVIGIPAFMLALENNFEVVKEGFIKAALKRALPASLAVGCTVLSLFLIQDSFNLSNYELSSLSVVTTLTIGLFLLYSLCRPFNFYRGTLFIIMLLASAIALLYFSDSFQIRVNTLSREKLLLLIVLVLASYPIMKVFTIAPKMISKAINEVNELAIDFKAVREKRNKEIKKLIIAKSKNKSVKKK